MVQTGAGGADNSATAMDAWVDSRWPTANFGTEGSLVAAHGNETTYTDVCPDGETHTVSSDWWSRTYQFFNLSALAGRAITTGWGGGVGCA